MTAVFAPTPLGWVIWVVFFLVTIILIILRDNSRFIQRMLAFFTSTGTFTLGISSKAFVYLQSNDTITTLYASQDQTQPLYQIVFIVSTALVIVALMDMMLFILSSREKRP